MLSQELVLKCFPNKECILYNLETALSIAHSKTEEPDRISLLCKCYHSIRGDEIEDAINFSNLAGYKCMARAIKHYYGANSSS